MMMPRIGRHYLYLSVMSLASACGGGGSDPVTASNCGVIGGSCSAPVPSTPAPTVSALFDVNTLTTYKGVGATHQITENRDGELYTAEQSRADSDKVEVSFDPRDAVFTLTIEHEESDGEFRYQDPAHRTDFNPNRTPQIATPNFTLFNYLESGGNEAVQTFFYKRPGNGTRYVTLAGFNRNVDSSTEIQRVRGAYAFGSQTPVEAIPTRGSGSFTGDMLATMVRNVNLEENPGLRSRLEWIQGQARIEVDFGAGSVTANLTGSVLPISDAFEGRGAYNPALPGATFSATGTASLDSSRLNYAGSISRATVAGSDISIAASSLDGTFFGPNASESGGAFRVIGSIPDQRVDILGSFVGARQGQ